MTNDKGKRKQQELLDIAEGVLATRGNANVALRDFAAAAGVSVGHLQHYFPTRAILIRAILERVLQRSIVHINKISGINVEDTRATPGPDDSARMVRSLLTMHHDENTVRLFLEIWSIASIDTHIAVEVRNFYQQYLTVVSGLIQQARPALDASRRNAIAATIVGLLEGASVVQSKVVSLRAAGTDDELVKTVQHLIHNA